MYVYFDKNGVVKEIINDDHVVAGSVNVNTIYAYWEDDDEDYTCNIIYRKIDGTSTGSYSQDSAENITLPADPNRDLYFFRYGQEYYFRKFVIPGVVLNNSSATSKAASFTLSYIEGASLVKTVDRVAFNISPAPDNFVEFDGYVNLAQYNDLLSRIEDIDVDVEWGDITGTLSNQTDLQTALNSKQNTINSGNKLNPDYVSTDASHQFMTNNEKLALQNAQQKIIAGTGISVGVDERTVSVDYSVTASKNDLLSKQNVLTPGAGISITNNVISTTNGIDIIVSTEASNTPYGVTWVKEGTTITGTLVASATTTQKIYLVALSSSASGNVYHEYVTVLNNSVYSWEQIGTTEIDLSNYYTKTQTDNLLNAKQNTLISGTNIKTINNQSILGSGDISITAGFEEIQQWAFGAVGYNEFIQYNEAGAEIKTVTTDISAAATGSNWKLFYDYLRETLLGMSSSTPAHANIVAYFSSAKANGTMLSNVGSYFTYGGVTPAISNFDSFKVECIGAMQSAAECTIKITLWTKQAEEYQLVMYSGNIGSVGTATTTGWVKNGESGGGGESKYLHKICLANSETTSYHRLFVDVITNSSTPYNSVYNVFSDLYAIYGNRRIAVTGYGVPSEPSAYTQTFNRLYYDCILVSSSTAYLNYFYYSSSNNALKTESSSDATSLFSVFVSDTVIQLS